MAELRVPNLNMVVLGGRLTGMPELRYTPSGKAVAHMRMAVSRPFKDAGGSWQEETLFIDVTTWGDLAERCKNRLTKGSPIVLQGRLRSRNWEGEGGVKRTAFEVVASNVQFLEKVGTQEAVSEVELPPEEEKLPEEGGDLPF